MIGRVKIEKIYKIQINNQNFVGLGFETLILVFLRSSNLKSDVQDYMVFVAPNPQPNPKYLAIIKPLSPFVWLIVFRNNMGTFFL